MKKIFYFIVFLFSAFLFAEEIEVRPGYIGFGTFHLTDVHNLEQPDFITEIFPMGNVCRVSFKNGYVLYLKKGQICKGEGISLREIPCYKVISWDYNLLICELEYVSDLLE